MSSQTSWWAWEQATETAAQKVVLLALADSADPESGDATATEWLARKCAPMTEQEIEQAITDLLRLGLLASFAPDGSYQLAVGSVTS